MSSKKLYFVLLGLVGILFIGLVGGAYGINNLLTSEAAKVTKLKTKSMAQEQQQLSLTKAEKDIKKYASLNKIAQTVVPQDKSQAAAVREIVNLAAANNIPLASITFPASTLGTSPNGSAATTGTGAGAAATTPSAAATSGNSKAAALSQLQPVKNIPGVYQLVINVQNDTDHLAQYADFLAFLNALEHDRRTAQVSAISIQPAVNNGSRLTFSLSLIEYIKP